MYARFGALQIQFAVAVLSDRSTISCIYNNCPRWTTHHCSVAIKTTDGTAPSYTENGMLAEFDIVAAFVRERGYAGRKSTARVSANHATRPTFGAVKKVERRTPNVE